jgi:predicted metalloprotease with PDZ domain
MSRLAPFVDAAAAIDRTNWDNTFISYYTYGAAIGLALDLTLRDRSNGRTSLDTYMQALWTRHGRPGQKEPGRVATPYTAEDLETVLGEVAGDRAFARDFFGRYIKGRDVVDYAALLARAGFVLRRRAAGTPFLTAAQLNYQGGTGARVTSSVAFDSALYKAGVDRDDLLVSFDGVALASAEALHQVLSKHKPGDQVALRFVRRGGETVTTTVVLEEDLRMEIVPAEKAGGGTLTDEQRRFRDDWLRSRVR